MINQFRNLSPINLVLLMAFAFFMRLAIFVHLPERLDFEFLEPYAKLLIQIPSASSFSSLANVCFATVLVIIQAILFNTIINRHSLLNKPTYLPALLYVTGSSLFLPFSEF